METALIGSDPPSSEYQYEPEESEVFDSDEEVLAPDSDLPVMDGMEVDADLAMEGGPIDAGLGDESTLGDGESFYLHILEDMTDGRQKGDLDDLMASLSGRTQESRQPAAKTGSTGVDAPMELPDNVNGGPSDEEVIPLAGRRQSLLPGHVNRLCLADGCPGRRHGRGRFGLSKDAS